MVVQLRRANAEIGYNIMYVYFFFYLLEKIFKTVVGRGDKETRHRDQTEKGMRMKKEKERTERENKKKQKVNSYTYIFIKSD